MRRTSLLASNPGHFRRRQMPLSGLIGAAVVTRRPAPTDQWTIPPSTPTELNRLSRTALRTWFTCAYPDFYARATRSHPPQPDAQPARRGSCKQTSGSPWNVARSTTVSESTLDVKEVVMPAVTVDDILLLPRISDPDPAAAQERPVLGVTSAPSAFEGEGFPVRRAFAGVDLRALDPFIHMDQMGEVDYAPGEPRGTAWHPHRGFETVTYIIDGTFRHQDSNGGGGLITNGDTQWMTAGGGILHIEEPPEDLVMSGGLFHGFQLWVNLPSSLKMAPARYQDIRAGQVALLSSADGGALVRVIAGEVDGHAGPGVTHTPITLLHITVEPGAEFRLPWRADFNALGYVLAGSGTVGADRRPVHTGQLAVFGFGESITIGAERRMDGPSPALEILLLGGEPVATYGPFVMNTKEELAQAFEDYQKGLLGSIPAQPATEIPADHPGHDVL